MSGGLVALLDDIATLAKVTASSIDDVAANAVKASSKAVGVVIDDTAVTPQYVSGLSPERELPIIGKIARGSLINKLFIILPIALLLTWLAPQVLPFLLIVGGEVSYSIRFWVRLKKAAKRWRTARLILSAAAR